LGTTPPATRRGAPHRTQQAAAVAFNTRREITTLEIQPSLASLRWPRDWAQLQRCRIVRER
jgi:hypothetical protein